MKTYINSVIGVVLLSSSIAYAQSSDCGDASPFFSTYAYDYTDQVVYKGKWYECSSTKHCPPNNNTIPGQGKSWKSKWTLLTACSGSQANSSSSSSASPSGSTKFSKLAWSDEFDTSSLNTSVWAYDLEQRNNEIHRYTKVAKNVRVENGNLVLQLHKESNGSFTSGALISHSKLFSGDLRIDVRAKHPTNPGSWPAAWLCGDVNDWPAQGEIDIVENINGRKLVFNNIWYKDSAGNERNVGNGNSPATNATPGDWHVYSAEREGNQIRFYLDGKLTYTYIVKGSDDSELLTPQHILLGTAYGGIWPDGDDSDWRSKVKASDFPATHYIDYVRLYKK